MIANEAEKTSYNIHKWLVCLVTYFLYYKSKIRNSNNDNEFNVHKSYHSDINLLYELKGNFTRPLLEIFKVQTKSLPVNLRNIIKVNKLYSWWRSCSTEAKLINYSQYKVRYL